ncbi:hypothetical protein EFA69_19085 [Rufibacter immobilis]|uniref:Uncharacterized protein n=1 Tax=Rufibacter immobilis TaxID=1348778 RepID=A0A3M9MTW7_9BACT|nr:hypothetical protein EFA69_19085 [Rufibacter immobilis]
MKEIIQYYGLKWYSVFLMYPVLIFNRFLETKYPGLSLFALGKSQGIDLLLELFLKGTTLGLFFYFLPNKLRLSPVERLTRAISLGWVTWFILFS